MEENNKPRAIKLGFLGDSQVGKTSLCNSYIGVAFEEDTIATIGAERFDKKISLKIGKEIKLIFLIHQGKKDFEHHHLKL